MKYTRVYEIEKGWYNDRKVLVGYRCEKGIIEVISDITISGNITHEYAANGWRFSSLKEAKNEIETNEVLNERGYGPRKCS